MKGRKERRRKTAKKKQKQKTKTQKDETNDCEMGKAIPNFCTLSNDCNIFTQ